MPSTCETLCSASTRRQLPIVAMHQLEPVAPRLEYFAGRVKSCGISIQSNQSCRTSLEHQARMPAQPDRAVDEQPTSLWLQQFEHFARHDRDVHGSKAKGRRQKAESRRQKPKLRVTPVIALCLVPCAFFPWALCLTSHSRLPSPLDPEVGKRPGVVIGERIARQSGDESLVVPDFEKILLAQDIDLASHLCAVS